MFVALFSASFSSFFPSSSPAEDDDDNKFNDEEDAAPIRSTNVAAMDPIPISPLLRTWSPANTLLLLLLYPTLLLLPTANAAAAAAVVVEEEEEEEEETALGEADVVLVAVAVLRSNLAVVVPRRRNDMYQ